MVEFNTVHYFTILKLVVLYSLLSIGDLQQSLVFTVLKLVFCFTTKNYRLVLQHRIQCFFFTM